MMIDRSFIHQNVPCCFLKNKRSRYNEDIFLSYSISINSYIRETVFKYQPKTDLKHLHTAGIHLDTVVCFVSTC